MAMVPTSSGGSGGSSFSNQGSLDYVALVNSSSSFSLAFLSRMAKAGIEAITFGFGRLMCTRLPIGTFGERQLKAAMKELPAKSYAADALWFGVGVRHILRELETTSEGCSLIALCAALSEGFSFSVAALVLYQLAKEFPNTHEYHPSYDQWRALVEVAAPVFASTTLGLRIHQIYKDATGGITLKDDAENRMTENAHPTDLAQILISIGEVVAGDAHSITVHGSYSCAWVAAWCEFVLGLRVLVRDIHGVIVFANYDASVSSAQVTVSFAPQGSQQGQDIVLLGASRYLGPGNWFILQQNLPRSKYRFDQSFSVGRVPQASMLSEVFGSDFRALVQSQSPSCASEQSPEGVSPDTAQSTYQAFTRLVAIYAGCLTSAHRDYISRACEKLPELQQYKNDFLGAFRSVADKQLSDDSDTLLVDLDNAERSITVYCHCRKHLSRGTLRGFDRYCLGALTRCIIDLMFLFQDIEIDVPLCPSVRGLDLLLDQSSQDIEAGSIPNARTVSSWKTFRAKVSDRFEKMNRARSLLMLFSGEYTQPDSNLALSDGRLYCYSSLIQELTSDAKEAHVLRLGPGHIEYRTKHFRLIRDSLASSDCKYDARETKKSPIDSSILERDTTLYPLESRMLVEEQAAGLYLSYHISSASGYATILPFDFLSRLRMATKYKRTPSKRLPRDWRLSSSFPECCVVQGEGRFINMSGSCVIRPLRNNHLGRCIAISLSFSQEIFLVETDSDLEMFARYWATEMAGRSEPYTLIS